MVLTRSQIRQFYDRFGRKQDSQAFYEDAGLDDLIAHSAFDHAQSVFELGCGTGRFALRLLTESLPSSASYLGIDLSRTMIDIAKERLAPFAGRAKVLLTDGAIEFPLPDHSVDRVVATYMLDLLPVADIRQAISEAHRVLRPGGKLCLLSLTRGVTLSSRVVTGLWSAVFHLRPTWVGGCRPIELEPFFDRKRWSIEYRNLVTQFGVPSEVLVATPAKHAQPKKDGQRARRARWRTRFSGAGSAMGGWFSKNFGDAMLALDSLSQVEDLFRAEYAKAGRPEDMAVFIRHESEGRLHCEAMAYFSPASRVIARAVDADPCARPSRDGLSLLAGAEESWSVLFPDVAD